MEVRGNQALRGTGTLTATSPQCMITFRRRSRWRRCTVDASWLDTTGADGSVARTGGSLVSAQFVVPSGGVFGAEVGGCCRGPWPRMW